METKQYKVVVAKFEGDEYEDGEKSIKVIELGNEWGGLDGQMWGEHYNETHDIKIESAEFYSLDYLKEHWVEV